MEYKRNCPKCGILLKTSNKHWHVKAEKENKLCLSCSLKGKPKSEEAKKNMSRNHADFSGEKNPFYGKQHTDETIKILSERIITDEHRKKISDSRKEWHKHNNNSFKGKRHSDKTRNKLSMLTTERFKDPVFRENFSKKFVGKPNPMKGKRGWMSIESRKQMSDSAKRRIELYGNNQLHSYNPKSISIIEEYGKTYGYNFQHAENGGEYQIPNTTFFVDAYDKEKNVVLEYDERHHFNSKKTINMDKSRQDVIGKILKCKFIRIKYTGEIKVTDYAN